jgi:hypothetical protein
MSNVYVFIGPTISVDEARAHLGDAVYLPPVAQGDVRRVGGSKPRAIGIIDGYFERVPAVWHKEILWAMSEGIHVFGASSMGALRAAELCDFGMVGVGWIFEQFASGALEDDDEVAVAHGAADTGYRAISEAMANIRRTLAAACDAGVVGAETHDALVRTAKESYYPERSYAGMLARARGVVADAELAKLRDWLRTGKINQKRDDAVAMLCAMRDFLAGDPRPKEVSYALQASEWWLRAERSAEAAKAASKQDVDTTSDESVSLDAMLEELRLDGDGAFARVRDEALLRYLVSCESRRRNVTLSAEELRAVSARFRRERGLLTPEQLHAWRASAGLDREQFAHLVVEEGLLAWARRTMDEPAQLHLPQVLHARGDFTRLRERAIEKRDTLAPLGLDNPGFAEAGVDGAELCRWYFEKHLGRSVPADVAAFAHAAGFETEEDFVRALLRSYCAERARS